jgi:hypothetical protein
MTAYRWLATLAVGSVLSLIQFDGSFDEGRLIQFFARAVAQTPREDLAAQIREQGYRCDKPLNAQKDIRRSKPDQAVWVLKCKTATFRIRLTPDLLAQVKRLN